MDENIRSAADRLSLDNLPCAEIAAGLVRQFPEASDAELFHAMFYTGLNWYRAAGDIRSAREKQKR